MVTACRETALIIPYPAFFRPQASGYGSPAIATEQLLLGVLREDNRARATEREFER